MDPDRYASSPGVATTRWEAAVEDGGETLDGSWDRTLEPADGTALTSDSDTMTWSRLHSAPMPPEAIAATPITLPSHASLLTGLDPPRHGVRHNGVYYLDGSVETLAERFRAAGYATGAVTGAVVLARRYGLAQGFESYDDGTASRRSGAGGFLERPYVTPLSADHTTFHFV